MLALRFALHLVSAVATDNLMASNSNQNAYLANYYGH